MNIFPKRGDVVSLFKSVSTLRFGMIKLNPYSKKSDFLVKQDLPNRKNGWLVGLPWKDDDDEGDGDDDDDLTYYQGL